MEAITNGRLGNLIQPDRRIATQDARQRRAIPLCGVQRLFSQFPQTAAYLNGRFVLLAPRAEQHRNAKKTFGADHGDLRALSIRREPHERHESRPREIHMLNRLTHVIQDGPSSQRHRFQLCV